LNRALRAALIVAAIVVGVLVFSVVAVVIFFYANGGMWPGTHSDPPSYLKN